MAVPVTAYLATSVGTLAAAAAATISPVETVMWTAAVLTSLGVIWKVTGPAFREIRDFLRSWNGQPAAPGIEARPGLPETVAYLGTQMSEIKGRDAQLADALGELNESSKEAVESSKDNGEKIDRLDERMIAVDVRVTDHRRRNDEQAQILHDALETRAQALEARLQERNDAVDARLDHISEDLLKAETMRASLNELLGIDELPGS